MKKIIVSIMAMMTIMLAMAQVPQKMSYQAVIRNSSNELITNKQVGMRISIIQGASDGIVVYTEPQSPLTNANGLVSIEIGGESGFESIDWASGPYYVKTETDPAGGTAYSVIATHQLLSVPYALYAGKSGDQTWNKNTNDIFYQNGNVGIGTGSPGAGLHLKGGLFPSSFMFLESGVGHDAGFRIYEGDVAKWHIFNQAGAGGLSILNEAFQPSLFVKQANAFVGIGTTAPAAQLHTTGTLRFGGAGTPGEGKVLTSDASGNATWQGSTPLGTLPGEMLYWNGHDWVAVEPGEDGDVLQLCDGVPIWGGCPPHLLTLQADPLAGGEVSGGGTYKPGVLVDVSARANTGYVFVNWTDGQDNETSDQASFTYTMPSAKVTLTANFQKNPDLGSFTDSRDGQTYKWAKIGNQVWMAENLNYASANSWCYDNNASNCEYYGRLYTWAAVMNGASSSSANPSEVQGVCPAGWHVPSDAEWTELINYVVLQGYPNSNVAGGAGNALKSCRQVDSPQGGACNTSDHPRWNSHSTHYGTDAFGFSALPGGYRAGDFVGIGFWGFWWSATEFSATNAWGRLMKNNAGNAGRIYDGKSLSFPLRCVRD